MLDVGSQDGIAYLVMELLDGEDLSVRLAREGPLPVDHIADLLLPVISGMAAAHGAGVIHRDLKPSNIFLARRHHGIEPVVVDFGISKSSDGIHATGSSLTGNAGAGTLPYMAPEQVRGSREVTAQCDQYALGVILYECATGGTPFWSEDRYDLLHAIMTAPLVPPSELNPRIDPALDAIVLRAMERDPGDRFSDVSALGAALWPLASEKVRAKWADEFGAPRGSQAGGVAVSEPPPGALVIGRGPRVAHRLPARAAVALAAALGVGAIAGATVLVRAGRPRGERSSTAVGVEAPPAATVSGQPAPAALPAEAAAIAPLDIGFSAAAPEESPAAKVPAPVERQPRPLRAGAPAPRSHLHAPADAPPPPSATVERGTANIPIVE
jgi:serine/threonine-protein kinase